MKTKKTPYNPKQLQFSFSYGVITPDGRFHNGNTEYYTMPKKMRSDISKVFLDCSRVIGHINKGELVLFVINKAYFQLDLFYNKPDLIKVIAYCSSLQLTGAETDLVALVFNCVEEENLAISRGITEKQLQEILSKIYEKMEVITVFQIKLLLEKIVFVQPKTAA